MLSSKQSKHSTCIPERRFPATVCNSQRHQCPTWRRAVCTTVALAATLSCVTSLRTCPCGKARTFISSSPAVCAGPCHKDLLVCGPGEVLSCGACQWDMCINCAKEPVGSPQTDSTNRNEKDGWTHEPDALDSSASSPDISTRKVPSPETSSRKVPKRRCTDIFVHYGKRSYTGRNTGRPVTGLVTLATEADEAKIVALAAECLPTTVAMNATNENYWMIMKHFGLYHDGPVTLQGWGPAKGVSFEFTTKIYKLTSLDGSKNGTIIGVLVISEPSEHMAILSQRNAALCFHYCQQLMVHKDYRGMGVATCLLEHVFAQYNSETTVWALDVDRENSAAMALYEKCGFVVRDHMHGVKLVPGSHFMLRTAPGIRASEIERIQLMCMNCAKESVGSPQIDSTTSAVDSSPRSPEISALKASPPAHEVRSSAPAERVPVYSPTDDSSSASDRCLVCFDPMQDIEGEGTKLWGCECRHNLCSKCGPKTFAKFRECPTCYTFKYAPRVDAEEFVPKPSRSQEQGSVEPKYVFPRYVRTVDPSYSGKSWKVFSQHPGSASGDFSKDKQQDTAVKSQRGGNSLRTTAPTEDEILFQASNNAVEDRRVAQERVFETEARIQRKQKLLTESRCAAKKLHRYYKKLPFRLRPKSTKQVRLLQEPEEDIRRERDELVSKLGEICPDCFKQSQGDDKEWQCKKCRIYEENNHE